MGTERLGESGELYPRQLDALEHASAAMMRALSRRAKMGLDPPPSSEFARDAVEAYLDRMAETEPEAEPVDVERDARLAEAVCDEKIADARAEKGAKYRRYLNADHTHAELAELLGVSRQFVSRTVPKGGEER